MTHTPVLLLEVLHWLKPFPGASFADCTGGLGGHAEEILKQIGPQGKLFICDYHQESVAVLKKKFLHKKNVRVFWRRFSLFFDNLDLPFDGILADFGISSAQLDNEKLGIGFLKNEAPLDMRLDPHLKVTASDILKTWTQEELADLFFQSGGERHSRKIAAALVYDREKKKYYQTTTQLKELCERVLGKYYRHKKIHPATKVFQALRIAVNEELKEIAQFLEKAPFALNPGGRLVVISFHEGEDRLVKNKFKELALTKEFDLPHKKALTPGSLEIAMNPRSRSAKLRILEKGT